VPSSSPGQNLRDSRAQVEVVSTSRSSSGDGVNLAAIKKLTEDLKMVQEEGNKRIIDDIAERLCSAEKAKDDRRRKELENKIAEVEIQSRDLEKKLAEAGSRNQELETKLNEVEIKNKKLEHRLTETESQKEKYLQKSESQDSLKRRQNEDLSKAQAQNQQLKTEVTKKTQEIEDFRQAADRAKAIKEKEMAKSESMLAEAKKNNDELKAKNKQLEQKLKQLDQQEQKSFNLEELLADIKAERDDLRQQIHQQEHVLAQTTAERDDLHQKLREQDHDIEQIPRLHHELAARERALEEKDRLLEAQKKEHQEAAARQVLEPRDRYRKHSCNEKENINKSRTIQELKDEIERLEFQIREEQQVSTLTPGEMIRMSKKVESELPWVDMCEEQKKNVSLQIELDETKWHVGILKRHMPIALHEVVRRDVEKGRLLSDI